jgi:hypothetical protein
MQNSRIKRDDPIRTNSKAVWFLDHFLLHSPFSQRTYFTSGICLNILMAEGNGSRRASPLYDAPAFA